eukprot:366239-Chlamydomonas_euryale.AAC.38
MPIVRHMYGHRAQRPTSARWAQKPTGARWAQRPTGDRWALWPTGAPRAQRPTSARWAQKPMSARWAQRPTGARWAAAQPDPLALRTTNLRPPTTMLSPAPLPPLHCRTGTRW